MLVPVSVFGTVPIVLYTGTCPAIQYDTRIHVHCPAIQYGTRIHVQLYSTVQGYMSSHTVRYKGTCIALRGIFDNPAHKKFHSYRL